MRRAVWLQITKCSLRTCFVSLSSTNHLWHKKDSECRARGILPFPLLKDIPVKGRTTEEIEQDIERRLRDGYLKEPSVSVFVIVYNEQSYTIMGEVMIDGIYPLPSEKKIDLVEAIANAKGFTPNAKDSRIELFRDGEKRVFDFNDLFKIKDPEKKIFIQPGDKIKVPARFF
jgi:protein involved in polysaccharide export with SLBB domain